MFLLLNLLFKITTQQDIQGKIINGYPVPQGKYPWLTTLHDQYGHFCGGTLIDATTIITAAHCFPPEWPFRTDMIAYAGITNLNDTASAFTFSLNSLTVHPKYASDNYGGVSYDIAILKAKLVQGNATLLPLGRVELDNGTFYSRNFARVGVAGWGATIEGNRGSKSRILLETAVSIVPQVQCQAMYPELDPTSICAYGVNTDACQGDSGGPLYALKPNKDVVLVGIVSYGIGCARADMPGVYSRISVLTPWINGIINPGLVKTVAITSTKKSKLAATSVAQKKK